ncbi:BQ5605_C136g13397 [Microbotryum silenes-dioicae]|uniref:BQ5605_C015g07717 protein n=1 Tax=Microbotryum silenes-dioicae TaxID=796604 RepID=A0A2X0N813_9BASI|nr:BQ5605_C015g07717 [Microbotryum silenes-dioicae]SGY88619.1 BQ5605_C136g13397 [Microbotryum silenes-dioicae]
MSEPQAKHIALAKHVLRYLKGTASLGFVYHRDLGTEIVPYSDADHAGNKSSQVSVSGHVVQMAGCAITWSARRQTGVAHLSVEAEYVALSSTCREVMWLRSLLFALGFPCTVARRWPCRHSLGRDKSHGNPANIMTKGLGKAKHEHFVEHLGLTAKTISSVSTMGANWVEVVIASESEARDSWAQYSLESVQLGIA